MEICFLLVGVAIGGAVGGVIIGSCNVGRECFLIFFVGFTAGCFFDWPVTTSIGGSALPQDGREHSGSQLY